MQPEYCISFEIITTIISIYKHPNKFLNGYMLFAYAPDR